MPENLTFKFIDIFFIILWLKIAHTAVSGGLLREFIENIGVVISSLFAFHYYPYLKEVLFEKFTFINEPYKFFLSFAAIFFLGIFIFFWVRRIFAALFESKEFPRWQRWLSFLLGNFRFLLLSSLIIFSLSGFSFYNKNIKESLSFKAVYKIAPFVYLSLGRYLETKKVITHINKEVKNYYETKKNIPGNSKKRH